MSNEEEGRRDEGSKGKSLAMPCTDSDKVEQGATERLCRQCSGSEIVLSHSGGGIRAPHGVGGGGGGARWGGWGGLWVEAVDMGRGF